MSKRTIKETVLETKFYGKLEVLGMHPHRKDYVLVKCECGVTKGTNLYRLNRGETKSCGCLNRGIKDLSIGDTFSGGTGGSYEIIDIKSSSHVEVKFYTGNTKIVSSPQARTGSIRNPFHKTVHGVGYFGKGVYKSRVGNDKTKTPQYRCWENMMSRCYYKEASRFHAYGGKGVSVCESWHNFQTFAKWFDENYVQGYDLDKDILGDGKVYSPEACRFIPSQLNKLLNTSPTKLGTRSENLPEGVCTFGTTKFIASFGSHYSGIFNTVEEAENAYNKFKTEYVKGLVEKLYKSGDLCEEIYNIMRDYDSVTGVK